MMRDRHMDSDESVAFGAGLHAANMSTAFRVRKFGAVDAASYALAVEFDVAATETNETPEVSERGAHRARCPGLPRCSAKLRTVLMGCDPVETQGGILVRVWALQGSAQCLLWCGLR
jgi:hypothetical protein